MSVVSIRVALSLAAALIAPPGRWVRRGARTSFLLPCRAASKWAAAWSIKAAIYRVAPDADAAYRAWQWFQYHTRFAPPPKSQAVAVQILREIGAIDADGHFRSEKVVSLQAARPRRQFGRPKVEKSDQPMR